MYFKITLIHWVGIYLVGVRGYFYHYINVRDDMVKTCESRFPPSPNFRQSNCKL